MALGDFALFLYFCIISVPLKLGRVKYYQNNPGIRGPNCSLTSME